MIANYGPYWTKRSPVVAGPETLLLLHGEGTNESQVFIDSSSYNRVGTILAGDNPGNGVVTYISTDQAKFGLSSLSFNGNNSAYYLEYTGNDLNFANGEDFTIETFLYDPGLYFGNYESKAIFTYGRDPVTWSDVGVELQLRMRIYRNFNNTSSSIELAGLRPNGSFLGDIWTGDLGPNLVTIGVWHHVAATRLNGMIELWFNGVPTGTPFADEGFNFNTGTISLGRTNNTNRSSIFLDDFRISRGAVYTAPFTPPVVTLT